MIINSLFSSSFRIAAQTLLNLQNTDPIPLPGPKKGHRYMLYSHVPFCESLCPFCSFNRFVFQEQSARSYFASLREEMRLVHKLGYDFESLYIGGGTPTVMIDELATTIDLARSLFSIREVSCETNPNHLDQHLVDSLASRVQRMSVGVQSFDDELLKKINRYERFGSGEETLQRIKNIAGGFNSLNVDMIFNFPGQDEATIRRDIQLVIDSGANQATFYPLMTSPSVARSLKERIGTVEYKHEETYYQMIIEEMSKEFDLSTAWTFSRKGGGLIDEYIIDSPEYVGIGSGSFSYIDGGLYVNTFSLDRYRHIVGDRKSPITGKRFFGKLDQMRYRFMMDLFGLRLDKKDWIKQFGRPLEKCLPLEMAFFHGIGAIAENNSNEVILSNKGRYLFVVMMREFFAGINRIRDQARQAVFLVEPELAKQVPSYSHAKP